MKYSVMLRKEASMMRIANEAEDLDDSEEISDDEDFEVDDSEELQ